MVRTEKQHQRLIRLVSIIILVFCSLQLQSHSNGGSDTNDDEGPDQAQRPPRKVDESKGVFYARVRLRDDIRAVNLLFAEVKVFPPEVHHTKWPGTSIEYNDVYLEEVNVKCEIRIRGIEAPSRTPRFSRPHVEVERERSRFDDAVHFLWGLISDSKTPNSRVLILQNPDIYEDTNIIEVDAFVRLGGHELSIAEVLVRDGHAQYGEGWDWGGRIVRKF